MTRADKHSTTVYDQDLVSDVTGRVGQQKAHDATDIPAGVLALEHGSLTASLMRLFGHAASIETWA
jgi:hypothetical protein